jgi:hypothetical protein
MYNILAFIVGIICKIIDDMMDLYNIENKYLLEFLKIVIIISWILLLQTNNYFIYVILFISTILGVIYLQNAINSDPYWFNITILTIFITTYTIIKEFNIELIPYCGVIIFIFMLDNITVILSEEIKNILPKSIIETNIGSYLFLKEDVEISKQKMYIRFFNCIILIYMLLYGHEYIVQYFNISYSEFKIALDIFGFYALGYYTLSTLTQWYMIYIKNINYKTVSIMTEDKKQHVQSEKDELEVDLK